MEGVAKAMGRRILEHISPAQYGGRFHFGISKETLLLVKHFAWKPPPPYPKMN
jgi:hypothetical protein